MKRLKELAPALYRDAGFKIDYLADISYDGNGNQIAKPGQHFTYRYNHLNLLDTIVKKGSARFLPSGILIKSSGKSYKQ